MLILIFLVTSSLGGAPDKKKRLVPPSGPSRRHNAAVNGLVLSGPTRLYNAAAVNGEKRLVPSGQNPIHN